MDLQHVLRRLEPAILNSSGTRRAQAEREEFFRLVEILFPLPNLGASKSVNSVCLRRNAPSSFSHSRGAGPVPTSLDEGMSSGWLNSASYLHGDRNPTVEVATNGQGKENTWWENIFPLFNPALHCVSTGWPKPFGPFPSPLSLPNVLAGSKVAAAAGECRTAATDVASLPTVAAMQLWNCPCFTGVDSFLLYVIFHPSFKLAPSHVLSLPPVKAQEFTKPDYQHAVPCAV